ncbi:O-antigen ligase family protein [Qipengyuania gaetbuli]|uniref:O-antigen ligase family protein n=1 Tax=Qipengyuania gaetbuli TaxID=266952 RepID=UPI001C994F4E|nr:O-antigen ligase family protein [Qipengyuania gaetbuli]MBY6013484.1 O-antigen ligase family protein [Qipengyuania gaetbuli]
MESLAILSAIVVLGLILYSNEGLRPHPSWPVLLLVFSVPVLAIIQLVPLPYGIWSGLPLRSAAVQAFELVGEKPVWTLSLVPQATLWSLLSLIPPLAAFFLAFALKREDRERMLWVVVVLAALSGLLEGFQALFGDSFFIHARSINAGPSGFFANQNTQADFMLVGIFAVLALLARRRAGPGEMAMLLSIGLFFVVCTLMTGSRMGALLLVIPMLAAFAMFGKRFFALRHRLAVAVGALVAFVAGGYAVYLSPVGQALIGRFANLTGGRVTDIWPDARYLAWEAFPYGMGLGTFRDSFELVEQLEVVDTTRANRAHFDWLEFLIEGGLPAALIIAGLVLLVGIGVWRKFRAGLSPVDYFAFGVLAVVAIHSIVDYPLRAIAMAVFAAIALAWIFSDGTQIDTEK